MVGRHALDQLHKIHTDADTRITADYEAWAQQAAQSPPAVETELAVQTVVVQPAPPTKANNGLIIGSLAVFVIAITLGLADALQRMMSAGTRSSARTA